MNLTHPRRVRDATRLRSGGAHDAVGAMRPRISSTATIAFPIVKDPRLKGFAIEFEDQYRKTLELFLRGMRR